MRPSKIESRLVTNLTWRVEFRPQNFTRPDLWLGYRHVQADHHNNRICDQAVSGSSYLIQELAQLPEIRDRILEAEPGTLGPVLYAASANGLLAGDNCLDLSPWIASISNILQRAAGRVR